MRAALVMTGVAVGVLVGGRALQDAGTPVAQWARQRLPLPAAIGGGEAPGAAEVRTGDRVAWSAPEEREASVEPRAETGAGAESDPAHPGAAPEPLPDASSGGEVAAEEPALAGGSAAEERTLADGSAAEEPGELIRRLLAVYARLSEVE